MKVHAILSPSSAHRWLNCPVSARLSETVEDRGSVYADEGTLAHAMCARKLKQMLGRDTKSEQIEEEHLRHLHTAEMDEYTDGYVSHILERIGEKKPTIILIEARLDFSDYIPGGFGTADCILVGDDYVDVIDFKYGKGVEVSAKNNPQMMIYALGALDYFGDRDIKHVNMIIYQPRTDNVSEWDISADDLRAWGTDTLKPKAAAAYKGEGETTPGDWCRFCPVKGTCRGVAAQSIALYKLSAEKLMTPEEVAEHILPVLPQIKSWISAVEEEALTKALEGVTYPGYKIVRGRSVRRITDAQAVARVLHENFYSASDYMKAPELKGLGDLEKLVGKKKFAELAGEWIVKPEGKPTLAPETDPRAAIDQVSEAFDGIN